MKILIWVHKNEAISGEITNHSFTRPYSDRNDEWVQIQITQDEFARLEDAKFDNVRQKIADISDKMRDEDFLVSQYNRNRESKDQITDASQIK